MKYGRKTITAAAILLIMLFNVLTLFGSDETAQAQKIFNIFKLKFKADMSAINALASYMKDDDPKIKKFAEETLSYIFTIRTDKLMPLDLIDLYKNSTDPKLRDLIRRALINLKHPKLFIDDLNSEDKKLQIAAALNLIIDIRTEESRLIYPKAFDILLQAYNEGKDSFEIFGAIALIAITEEYPEAVEAVQKVYKEEKESNRTDLCGLFQQIYQHENRKSRWLSSMLLYDFLELFKNKPSADEEIKKWKESIKLLYEILVCYGDANIYNQIYNLAKSYQDVMEVVINSPANSYPKNKLILDRLKSINLGKEPDSQTVTDIAVLCGNIKYPSANSVSDDFMHDAGIFFLSILDKPWLNIKLENGTNTNQRNEEYKYPIKGIIIEAVLNSGNEEFYASIVKKTKSEDISERKEAYSILAGFLQSCFWRPANTAFIPGKEIMIKESLKILCSALKKEKGDILNTIINQIYSWGHNVYGFGDDASIISKYLPDNYKTAIKNLIVENADINVKRMAANSLSRYYPDDNAVISVYKELLNDKNEEIQKLALSSMLKFYIGKESGINLFVQLLNSLGKNTKDKYLSDYRESMYFIGDYNGKIDSNFDKSLNSSDIDEFSLAMFICSEAGVDATLRQIKSWRVYLDIAWGKIFEMLERENVDYRAKDTVINCMAYLCRNRFRIDSFFGDLLVLLAEQYDKIQVKFTKKNVLWALGRINDIGVKSEDVKKQIISVFEKAGSDEDKEISGIAKSILDQGNKSQRPANQGNQTQRPNVTDPK